MRTPLALVLALLAGAACDREPTSLETQDAFAVFPEVIDLPDGFWPEGITFGRGSTFYVTSLAGGSIYRADALTGTGSVLVHREDGESVGIKYDPRGDRLVVAGGMSGKAFTYSATTGALLGTYHLADEGMSLINDVILIGKVAYFTDSFNAVIYRVLLDVHPSSAVSVIPLGGDWVSAPSEIGNANGIAATPTGQLIVLNMAPEALYLVDPATGHATMIDLGGAAIPGDGILLAGNTLYVVAGPLNEIAKIQLSADFRSGTIVEMLKSPALRFPSTIARFGNALYAVNARFDVAPEPTTEYEAVRIPIAN